MLPFHERLTRALEPLCDRYDFEILFSDNRSTDRTVERVLELRAKDPRVQLLSLSRNFGYQHSIVAALRQARGDAMCVIDADCEDPPEMIVTFIGHWEEGFDIVYGVRDHRAEPFVLTWVRKLFYRVNKMIADSDILLDMAEFCLISADVRDAVVANRSTFPSCAPRSRTSDSRGRAFATTAKAGSPAAATTACTACGASRWPGS